MDDTTPHPEAADTEQHLANTLCEKLTNYAFHSLTACGEFHPMAVLAKEGAERIILNLAFHNPASKEHCYQGVAAVAGYVGADLVVLANDGVYENAPADTDIEYVRPLENPAAKNCLMFNILGQHVQGAILLPYIVDDTGTPNIDSAAISEISLAETASMPPWGAPVARAVLAHHTTWDGTYETLVRLCEQWTPEITRLILLEDDTP